MHISTSVAAGIAMLLGVGGFAAFASIRTLLGQFGREAPGLGSLLTAGLGAGLLAFGCRLCVAEGFVSWSPYLDQWHAEIGGVAVPLAHGTLGLGDLVAGNNEHRVILTRAVALGIIMIDGSWDNRVLVVVNYLLESAAIAWVCVLSWGSAGWARGSIIAAAAFLPMLLVCDWETVVSSNQMQFVFMAVGSVVGLSLAHDYSLRSWGSWAALACAVLMLASMASGFLTALSLAASGLIVAHAGRRGVRTVAGFCAVCAGIGAVGWLTRVEFTALYPIYAKGVGSWMKAFLMYAAWPLPPNLLGFSLLWAPWGALLAYTLWKRRVERLATFGIGLGIWALLQSCALGWARAGFLGLVSSRYTEFLGWGFVANAACAAVGIGCLDARRVSRVVPWTAIVLWLAAVGGTEAWRSHAIYRPFLEVFREQTREHEQRLGTFMRTMDPSAIEGVEFPRIPYAASQMLPILRDPLVQPLFPAPLRRDLVRDRDPQLLFDTHDGPLNFVAIRVLGSGPWWGISGAALLFAVGMRERNRTDAFGLAGPSVREIVRASASPRRPGRSQA
jgi:hypothetical protein